MAETDLKEYLSDLANAINVEAALSAPPKPEAQSQPAKTPEPVQNVDVKDPKPKSEAPATPREPTSSTPVAVPAKIAQPDLGASVSSSTEESKGLDDKSKALPQLPEEAKIEGETDFSRSPKRSSWQTSGEITINFKVTPSMMLSPPLSRTTTEEEAVSAPEPVEVAELPSPAPVLQIPSAPQRPARPYSLRLSSIPEKSGLTTSRVIVIDSDKQYTSNSYMTQPHTGYITAAPLGSRIKYGRGKYATTELVPQPSDDAQDPLVSRVPFFMCPERPLTLQHHRTGRPGEKSSTFTHFS